MRTTTHLTLACLMCFIALAFVGSSPAEAQCIPHLTYVDLVQGGSIDTSGPGEPLEVLQLDRVPRDPTCDDLPWWGAVVKVDVPPGCERFVVWVDYRGKPAGWTVNIGDSKTNNGFGGDGGSLPDNQNAELQILDRTLRVYNAGTAEEIDMMVNQLLDLEEGAMRFTVEDQKVTWGQPFGFAETPKLQRLFFMPDNPVGAENRTFYVGLNRVVNPTEGEAGRTGCGISKALVMFE